MFFFPLFPLFFSFSLPFFPFSPALFHSDIEVAKSCIVPVDWLKLIHLVFFGQQGLRFAASRLFLPRYLSRDFLLWCSY
ncbi:hypothetical protein F4819DRAFT_466456 [Hypoxylon fuscum]|nr:hypothetical protein F4819DRAFT_466456 [Hypoxylon fuscum]